MPITIDSNSNINPFYNKFKIAHNIVKKISIDEKWHILRSL